MFAEPWMEDILHPQDKNDPGPVLPLSDHVPEDQSVWDEPGLSSALAGEIPPDAVTWYRWYRKNVDESSGLSSWLVTLVVVLTSGFFAVIGTFAAQSVSGSALIAVTVIGPTTEEIMKIALTLWIVEKRPWLYRNGIQILLCALASGAAFAAVENIIYLKVYVPDPPPGLAEWRWTVCVLLHSGCSTISGIGVWKIWRRLQQQQRAPMLADGASWIFAAIIVHGTYNGTVTLMELSGFGF
ncbi:MAG: PrsW family glutamic-type intramembrane protease [Fuerstiella sp.]|nr:PrsW family glutamic-type intramembrane protease [Fuerstiella sp.]